MVSASDARSGMRLTVTVIALALVANRKICGQAAKPTVGKATSASDSVPYRIIETRGGMRIAVISPRYRNEASLRRLGDQLHKDFAAMVPVIVGVYDNVTAAKLYDRYVDGAGEVDPKTDAFYDSHMVANYSPNFKAGTHAYAIWPNGARGRQIDIVYR